MGALVQTPYYYNTAGQQIHHTTTIMTYTLTQPLHELHHPPRFIASPPTSIGVTRAHTPHIGLANTNHSYTHTDYLFQVLPLYKQDQSKNLDPNTNHSYTHSMLQPPVLVTTYVRYYATTSMLHLHIKVVRGRLSSESLSFDLSSELVPVSELVCFCFLDFLCFP